jgi:hypothetical protein
MQPSSKDRFIQAACSIYRALLYAYPASFRRRFRDEMTQVFRDRLRDMLARRRAWRISRFALAMIWDLTASIVRERVRSLSVIGVTCVIASIGIGCYAAYVYQHNATEVYPVLAVSLVGSFILGLVRPSHAWRWAMIVAWCIAFSPFAAGGFRARVSAPGSWAILLVVMVPAMIGTYTGSVLRRVAHVLQ